MHFTRLPAAIRILLACSRQRVEACGCSECDSDGFRGNERHSRSRNVRDDTINHAIVKLELVEEGNVFAFSDI